MKKLWDHNIEYHRVVLASVPPSCEAALDVGCGEGILTRRLARRTEQVTGLDLDAPIIATAERRSHASNVAFTIGDIMTYPFEPGTFTFVCTVATLHHVPLGPALGRLVELLAPGGVLAVIGLYRSQGATDAAYDALGLLANQVKRRFCTFEPSELRSVASCRRSYESSSGSSVRTVMNECSVFSSKKPAAKALALFRKEKEAESTAMVR